MKERIFLQDLQEFFRDNPRKMWRTEIEKRIQRINTEWEVTILNGIIDEEKGWACNFLPEMLEPDYQFQYKVGDVVKLNDLDGIFIIVNYPLLDKRSNVDYKKAYMGIDLYGSCYEIIGVDEGKVCGCDVGEDPISWDECIQSQMTLVEDANFEEGTFLRMVQKMINSEKTDFLSLNPLIETAIENYPEMNPLSADFEQVYLEHIKKFV